MRIGFGTDAGVYPHGLNARQFAYMVRYGTTPLQAIRSATVEAAALLGREGEFGALTAGAFADMIAVEGDPLADVRLLESVAGVIKGGEMGPDRLYRNRFRLPPSPITTCAQLCPGAPVTPPPGCEPAPHM